MVIFGLLDTLKLSHFRTVTPDQYKNIGLAPTLTLTIGCIIFIIAFLGCLGAVLEIPFFLYVFAAVLLFIFLLQMALGIFTFIIIKDKETLEASAQKSLKPAFEGYYTSKTGTSKEIVDVIQKELKCCGLEGLLYWIEKKVKTPESCSDESTGMPFKAGCTKNFFMMLYKSGQVVGITVIVLSTVEVLGALFAYCLASSIKKRKRNEEEDED